MYEIKECPICGTESFTEISISGKMIILKIRCNNSECGIAKTTVYKTKYQATFDDMEEAINSATQSWNNRIKTT